jgi:hypothetical protein
MSPAEVLSAEIEASAAIAAQNAYEGYDNHNDNYDSELNLMNVRDGLYDSERQTAGGAEGDEMPQYEESKNEHQSRNQSGSSYRLEEYEDSINGSEMSSTLHRAPAGNNNISAHAMQNNSVAEWLQQQPSVGNGATGLIAEDDNSSAPYMLSPSTADRATMQRQQSRSGISNNNTAAALPRYMMPTKKATPNRPPHA